MPEKIETFDAERMQAIEDGVPEVWLAHERLVGHPVWDTKSLQEEFEVRGFLAPFVSVRRKSDGKEGALMFTHHPRFYFRFVTEDGVEGE